MQIFEIICIFKYWPNISFVYILVKIPKKNKWNYINLKSLIYFIQHKDNLSSHQNLFDKFNSKR